MRITLSAVFAAATMTTALYAPAPAGAHTPAALAWSASQARPGLAPAGARGTYLDELGRVLSIEATDAGARTTAASLGGCTPGNGSDNPHYTAPDVSGHGTYVKGTCTKNTAKVYNCLYEWYTDNTWRRKACSAKMTVTAGGGAGNRSNARHACDSTSQNISWRNHEDVDVIGEADSADTPYRQAAVFCVVN